MIPSLGLYVISWMGISTRMFFLLVVIVTQGCASVGPPVADVSFEYLIERSRVVHNQELHEGLPGRSAVLVPWAGRGPRPAVVVDHKMRIISPEQLPLLAGRRVNGSFGSGIAKDHRGWRVIPWWDVFNYDQSGIPYNQEPAGNRGRYMLFMIVDEAIYTKG